MSKSKFKSMDEIKSMIRSDDFFSGTLIGFGIAWLIFWVLITIMV